MLGADVVGFHILRLLLGQLEGELRVRGKSVEGMHSVMGKGSNVWKLAVY